MAGQTIIAGFSSADKVPGAVGEVLYGVSGQSAASIPLFVLVCGLMGTGGALTADTQVQQVFSKGDVDNYAKAGSELAGMAYDAIDTAPNVPVFLASPALPVGAVAAGTTLAITGTWTSGGQITLRANGKPIVLNVSPTDTPSTFATNAAATINGALAGRAQVTATASTSTVAIAWKTPGVRGNQAILFLDTSLAPSGMVATLVGLPWVTATAYGGTTTNLYVVPTVANGYYYKATAILGTGTSGITQPTWPTVIGTTVVDNSGANQITWTCWGAIATGGGAQLGGGSGLETYTNLLSTLSTSTYARIALAANDATSIGAWKTAVDAQAGAPTNILQQVLVAQNTTLAAATSLAQTTCNDPLFQVLWETNAESHPSRIAAAMAALRASAEQQDPNAAYNYAPLVTVAPMSQKADWPSRSTLISALNNSVTPITSTGDGYARVVRSICTKSLTGGAPDYSTLDTGQVTVPQFILNDWRLYWNSVVAPSCPRVQDDPDPNTPRLPPSGVMYPRLWASLVFAKLMQYAAGILSGTSASVAPIILAPTAPVANFDATAKRIMVAANTVPAYNNAQVGISVRQGT